MISAIEDNESVVRCLEAGADDFLPKPFDPAILRARIGAGLNRKRLTDLEQDRVRDVFARFLPEPIAAEMLTRSDGRASIAPVRLYATVMFVDLRGFTTFADTAPTEQIVSVLNRYQATMGDAVLDHGGTVVDYLGDGLMAAFERSIETGRPRRSRDRGRSRHGLRASRRLQRMAPSRGGRGGVRDGDRAQLGARDVGNVRLGSPDRLRGDRGHDQHGGPDPGPHEADRELDPARRSDADEHDRLNGQPDVRRRVRYPGKQSRIKLWTADTEEPST